MVPNFICTYFRSKSGPNFICISDLKVEAFICKFKNRGRVNPSICKVNLLDIFIACMIILIEFVVRDNLNQPKLF